MWKENGNSLQSRIRDDCQLTGQQHYREKNNRDRKAAVKGICPLALILQKQQGQLELPGWQELQEQQGHCLGIQGSLRRFPYAS